jgi:Uma2 family endonuclease
VSQKLLSAKEFARLPDPADGSQQELVKGVVVTLPVPKTRHGLCCSKTDRRLAWFIEQNDLGTLTCNDAGFVVERDPDTVFGPDLAFWTKDRLPVLPEDDYTDIPPDLAVEVVSPSDTHSRLLSKVIQYLKCGVKLIWLIDPELRIATTYRALDQSRVLEENEVLTGEDILPGFQCKVADLLP